MIVWENSQSAWSEFQREKETKTKWKHCKKKWFEHLGKTIQSVRNHLKEIGFTLWNKNEMWLTATQTELKRSSHGQGFLFSFLCTA